ncbi:MAG: class III extradiol ring-cleavage dioxygenase [Betaproteobacteria bacterium]
MTRLPTVFLSHGSPMHAKDAGAAGRAWTALARSLPRPEAVLMVSAHWDTSLPMLTGNPKPQTIHDFGGFPDELYKIRYDAPGAPEVAARAATLLKAAGLTAGIDGCRGLDHGAWVPLLSMYPEADVPVVQLSVQTQRGIGHHLHLGAAIAPLADEGVLIVGSGHATHNLRDWMTTMHRPSPLPYVPAFADWLAERLAAHDRDAVIAYREQAPEAARAHPTEEHFVPLPVAWAAAGDNARAVRVHRGQDGAALSMDAYRFDPAG